MRFFVAWTFALLAAPLAAQAPTESSGRPWLTLSPRYWFPQLARADLLVRDRVGGGPVLGQTLDVAKDLGVDRGPTPFPGIRGELRLGSVLSLRGGYQRLRYDGTGRVASSFEFAGYRLQVNSTVTTDVRLDFYELGLLLHLTSGASGRLALLADVKLVDFLGRVEGQGQVGTGPVVAFTEQEEELVPVPLVGALAELRPFEGLELFGEVKWLRVSGLDRWFTVDGSVEGLDWEAGLRLLLGRHVALTAGYRSMFFSADVSESGPRKVEAELGVRGWFGALQIRF